MLKPELDCRARSYFSVDVRQIRRAGPDGAFGRSTLSREFGLFQQALSQERQSHAARRDAPQRVGNNKLVLK